jgi:hypothetical protein
MISEGVRFLLSSLLQYIPLQAVTYGLLTLAENRYSTKLRLPSKALLSILTSFLQIFARKGYRSFQIERDIRRRGARHVPLLPTKKLGGRDLIQDMLEEAEHGYLATLVNGYFVQLGSETIRLRIFGDEQVGSLQSALKLYQSDLINRSSPSNRITSNEFLPRSLRTLRKAEDSVKLPNPF